MGALPRKAVLGDAYGFGPPDPGQSSLSCYLIHTTRLVQMVHGVALPESFGITSDLVRRVDRIRDKLHNQTYSRPSERRKSHLT